MLDKKGITISEASRAKNAIKERVKLLSASAENFKIITSTVIQGGQSFQVDNNNRVEDWDSQLRKKSELYSLSTWIGEAIDKRNSMLEDLKYSTFGSTTLDLIPEGESFNHQEYQLSFNKYLEELDVKQLSEYYTAVANATHIGKFIHNFDKILGDFEAYVPTSFEVLDKSGNAVPVKHQLLYTREEIVQKVEELRAEHRVHEKVLNSHKARHEQKVFELEQKRDKALAEYNSNLHTIRVENSNRRAEAFLKFEKEKAEKMNEIAKLKIVIPNSMQELFDDILDSLTVK